FPDGTPMSEFAFRPNTLYYGDCLDVMKNWPDASVDLIYLDPPFKSDAKYNILFGKDTEGKARDPMAQFTAFQDTWYWTNDANESVEKIKGAVGHPAHKAICGLAEMLPETGMLAYLVYMADRTAQMRRLLKDTGSIYLHCDPSASHYLKTIMDCVFGAKNFRNEIVWRKYAGRKSNAKVKYPTQHDCIFFYAKDAAAHFAPQYLPMTDLEISKKYTNVDEDGRRYRLAWGRNYQTKGEQRKIYLDDQPGRMIGTLWVEDGLQLNTSSSERLGYPTQKPLALLERIIQASSNKGEVVLDPFCGCGTTAHAAYNLKRKFLGIDISPFAITRVCKDRLKNAAGMEVRGLPTDLQSAHAMWKDNPFKFERWAVTTLPGFVPNDIQTGDGGIDGRGMMLHKPEGEKGYVVAQVKGGSFTPDQLRALLSQLRGKKVSMGVFVTLEKVKPTPTMLKVQTDAGSLTQGTHKYNRIQFWSIAEYFEKVRSPLPPMRDPGTGGGMQETIPTE
ncbi:MAG: hypothetical protein MPK34_05890, partial [Gammaproteobacteria bacterium]|nr:hypothetical protein [Gammaproteobacteria bacterium]